MSKEEFLKKLHDGLYGLPADDIMERVTFYSEMIDDKIEEGCSEFDAVSSVGLVNDIINQILADVSFENSENYKNKNTKNKGTYNDGVYNNNFNLNEEKATQKEPLNAWKIAFLIITSPIWLILVLSVIIVVLSLYFALWSIIVSLWAVFASLIMCSLAGIIACVVLIATSDVASAIAMFSAFLIFTGLSIFLFLGCKAVTFAILRLTKKTISSIKHCIN